MQASGGVTIAAALRDASARLASISDTARLDAELLMAQALGTNRSDLLLRHMADPVPPIFAALIARREQHEPVAYILGRQDFFGRDFRVAPGVLIPRADSETVVAAALAACPSPERVLDLGTGSGALLVTILVERPCTQGVGMDRDPLPLKLAKQNAAQHAPGSNCKFLLADWREPHWREELGSFDLILANPPYVEDDAMLLPGVRDWEPKGALFAGPDGLDDYRILIPQLPSLLSPGGVAVLEIGATQAEAVAGIAGSQGFAVVSHADLAGRPRALVLRLGLGKAGGSG